MEYYPQLFDKVNVTGIRGKGTLNDFAAKYTFRTLEGSFKARYEEFRVKVKHLARPMVVSLFVLFGLGLLFMLFLSISMNVIEESGFMFFAGVTWLWVTTAASLVLAGAAGVVFLVQKRRFNIINEELMQAEGNKLDKQYSEYFGLPDNMLEISFLQRNYRAGKSSPVRNNTYADELLAFLRDDSVFIMLDDVLYRIPVSDCVGAGMVEGKEVFVDRVKHENRKQLYKEYGVKSNNNNGVYVKKIGRLMFQKNGIVWTIDVPPYSFDTFKALFSK